MGFVHGPQDSVKSSLQPGPTLDQIVGIHRMAAVVART